MKKFLNTKFGEIILYSAIFLVHLLFTIILYSLKLKQINYSVWTSHNYRLYANSTIKAVMAVSIIFIILFVLGILISLGSMALHLLRKKRWGYYISMPYQIGVSLMGIICQIILKMFSVGSVVLIVFNLALMTFAFVVLLSMRTHQIPDKQEEKKSDRLSKIILLILETLSIVVVSLVFFIPLYSIKKRNTSSSFILIQALGSQKNELYVSILFIIIFLIFFACLMYYISTLSYYFRKDKSFSSKSKGCVQANIGVTLLFFLMGYMVCFYQGTLGEEATTISYIPFLLSLVIFIIHSIFQGKLGNDDEKNTSPKNKLYHFEPLIYVIIVTILLLSILFLNVIEIHIELSTFATKDVVLSGYKLLSEHKNLEGGFQLLSFILLASYTISAVLLALSLSSYFAKYKDYYKVVKVTMITNVIFLLLLGLFGLYYQIAQKVNEEAVKSLLESLSITIPTDYVYTVSSQTLYIFIASFVVLLVMIFRGQLNYHIAEEAILKVTGDGLGSKGNREGEPLLSDPSKRIEFDACPAFTEIDSKLEYYKADLAKRSEAEFKNLTLPNLVRFIVDYARECRLHLSYSLEDIATFVAGLGASRLAILQGMSGTGKTSLPKIFTEAILGNCEIVEVESSWRDKNELIGYYNEFSKCFTPKKFTQALYKARLNPAIPTFIVLDEMNLSRIEYYFSDFLSLMEHEEDKRQIKLLNIKLSRIVEDQNIEYYGLTEGHTILMPKNVWFIGTANRDESTFEISDKVYDRAQTMNFNKRAPKIHSYSEPLLQCFVSYERLSTLFEDAKNSMVFDAEGNELILAVEKLLLPYNISFGNRILKQMEDFVKIYCACFGDKQAVLKDAVEKILLSKVVSKLEVKIVENKESLAAEFDKLGLLSCSAFVRKLNED